MLEVSSPDYSQQLDIYLKAHETFRVADKNYDRAKDLYDHHACLANDVIFLQLLDQVMDLGRF